ncbi:hypothetical protein BJ742DRAFT_876120 [Cladochytrium replicatum]|nr:hypothetical protein BJ742DRAFT_876120 [Cladochytrium replicatum]
MDEASKLGHIAPLELHLANNSSRPCEYIDLSMNEASTNGHIHILEWWRTSGLDLRWGSTNTESRIDVEKWLQIKLFEPYPMDLASDGGHVAVLEWWKANTATLTFSSGCRGVIMISLQQRGGSCELQRTCESTPFYAMDMASKNGREVLDWWMESGLALKWYQPMNLENFLEWWRFSGQWESGARHCAIFFSFATATLKLLYKHGSICSATLEETFTSKAPANMMCPCSSLRSGDP